MKLRRATSADAMDILTWRNDPQTRAMSKTSEMVDAAAHLAWFENAVHDPRRLLLIGETGDAKAGMVRFDLGDHAWLASINIAPEMRGKGYGPTLLGEGVAFLEKEHGHPRIIAEIALNNMASIVTFKKCGFTCYRSDDEYMYMNIPETIPT